MSGNNKKMLIVEKDRDFAEMISTVMTKYGFECLIEEDGDRAVEVATGEQPNIIILCIELGNVSGYMICKKLKKDEATQSIPLILTSAEATERDFEQHRKLKVRADDYLHKPFTDEDFIPKVQNLVGFELSQDEYQNLEEKVHEFLEERERLMMQIDDQKDRIAELERSLEEAQSAPVEAEVALDNLGAEVEAEEAQSRIAELETELARRDERIAELESQSGEGGADGEELERVRMELDETKRMLEEETQQAGEAREEAARLREELEQQSAGAAEDEQDGRAKDARIKELEREVDDLRERFEAADLNLKMAKEELEDFESLKGEIEKQKEHYESQLAERDKKEEERKQLREELSHKVNELTEERRSLKEKADQAETELVEAREKLQTYEEEAPGKDARIQELEEQAEKQSQRIEQLEGEAYRKSEELEGARGELEELRGELEGARGELEGARGEADGMREELEELRRRSEELDSQLREEQEKREKIRAFLDQALEVQ